jgi:hypothetical protein
VIVTEALAGPSAMSGSDIALVTSDALCAIASAIRRSGENPTRAASPVNDRAVVKTRRVMNNSCSEIRRPSGSPLGKCSNDDDR